MVPSRQKVLKYGTPKPRGIEFGVRAWVAEVLTASCDYRFGPAVEAMGDANIQRQNLTYETTM